MTTDSCESEENLGIFEIFNEEDYAELVDYYRQGCPDVPNEIIEKVASTYGPSIVCIDTADLIEALSYPGEKIMFAEDITAPGQWLTAANKICQQIVDKGIDLASPGYVVGLMIYNVLIEHPKMDDYYSIFRYLKSRMSTLENGRMILSLSFDKADEAASLTLILSGFEYENRR